DIPAATRHTIRWTSSRCTLGSSRASSSGASGGFDPATAEAVPAIQLLTRGLFFCLFCSRQRGNDMIHPRIGNRLAEMFVHVERRVKQHSTDRGRFPEKFRWIVEVGIRRRKHGLLHEVE